MLRTLSAKIQFRGSGQGHESVPKLNTEVKTKRFTTFGREQDTRSVNVILNDAQRSEESRP